jgi:hypothetical protein
MCQIGRLRDGSGVQSMDEVHWWEDPIFDDEGDVWRQLQHRKLRVARFLAVVRCVPRMKRWATRAGETCYAPGGRVAQRLAREWDSNGLA